MNSTSNLKRVVATLLVLTMVFSSCSLMFTAMALEETEKVSKQEELYKVSLSSEHGDLSFEDTEDKEKSFKEGTRVKVRLTPDVGYELEHLTLHQKTENERNEIEKSSKKSKSFSFNMPNSDIEVEAVFSNIKENKEKKEIKQKEDKEYFDTVTSEEKSLKVKKEAPYFITTKSLLYVKDEAPENLTLNDFWSNEKYMNSFLGQYISDIPLYVEGDNYVAFVGFALENKNVESLQDIIVAKNNLNGEVIKDAKFDEDTLTVKIPKKYFKGADKWTSPLQIQLMMAYNLEKSNSKNANTSKVAITVEAEDKKFIDKTINKVENVPNLNTETTVKILDMNKAKTVNSDNLRVYINDAQRPYKDFAFNPLTGELTVLESPVDVQKITVKIKKADKDIKQYKPLIMQARAASLITNPKTQMNSVAKLSNFDATGLRVGSSGTTYCTLEYWEPVGRFSDEHNAICNYLQENSRPYMYGTRLSPYPDKHGSNYGGSEDDYHNNVANPNKGLGSFYDVNPQPHPIQFLPIRFVPPSNATFDGNGRTYNFNDGNYTKYKDNNPWLAMACAHVGESASGINRGDIVSFPVGMRVLYVDQEGDNPCIVVAFWTNKAINTQSGAAIYKFGIEPQNGHLKLRKYSANPDCTSGNKMYDLTGTKYGIYSNQGCTNLIRTVSCNANGYFDDVELKKGTYYVKELSAGKGYEKDNSVYPVHITSGNTTTKDLYDTPINDPIAITLEKKNSRKSPNPLPLINGEFTIDYYDGHYNKNNLPNSPKRTWVIRTDEDGYCELKNNYLVKEKSNNLYFNKHGQPIVPVGTIRIRETKAPKGYDNDPDFINTETGDSNGDFVLAHVKYDGEMYDFKTGNSMNEEQKTIMEPETPRMFSEITDYSTDNRVTNGLKHITLTDKITLWSLPAEETYRIEGYLVNKRTKKPVLDINGNEVKHVSDDFIAKRDDKLIHEVIKTMTYSYAPNPKDAGDEIVACGRVINVKTGKVVVEHKELDDEKQTTYVPKIRTQALDNRTNSFLALISDRVVIRDTLNYESILKGEQYLIKGTLVDYKTGIPVTSNGKKITAEKKFTPNSRKGSEYVDFKFNAKNLKLNGKKYDLEDDSEKHKLVVLEEVYYVVPKNTRNHKKGDLVLVGEHKDTNDLAQTIEFPHGKTNFKDTKTNEHQALPEKKVKLKDTFYYHDLKPEHEYTLVGTVMIKGENKPLLDKNGKKITKTVKYKTPKLPAFSRKSDRTVDGSIDVDFEIDASLLKGKSVVAFERLYDDGIEIIIHEDINDEKQTVHFPNGKTNAIDTKTGTNQFNPNDKECKISDTISYENLLPNTEYIAEGIIMDKDLGTTLKQKALIGKKEVKGRTKFVTGSADKDKTTVSGTVNVDFNFNGMGMDNKTLVVFERIYLASAPNEPIFIHEDYEDEAQTIYASSGHTTAMGKETQNKHTEYSKTSIVTDTMFYDNLMPEKEYELTGYLMDKDTNKPILQNGKKIEARKTFVTPSLEEYRKRLMEERRKQLPERRNFDAEDIESISTYTVTTENGTVEIGGIYLKLKNGAYQVFQGEELDSFIGRFGNFWENVKTIDVDIEEPESDKKPEISENEKKEDKTPKLLKKSKNIYYLNTENGEFEISGEEYISSEDGKIIRYISHELPDEVFEDHSIATDWEVYCDYANCHKDDFKDAYLIKDKDLEKLHSGSISFGSYLDNNPKLKSALEEHRKVVERRKDRKTVSGFETLEFEVDTTLLQGKTIVVFEDVLVNGKELIVHHRINDKEETIYVPEFKTSVKDKNTGKRTVKKGKPVYLVDMVSFKNLIPEHKYRAYSVLMNKKTKEPVTNENGEPITGETKFVAKEFLGKVGVELKLDTKNLEPGEYVVFEDVYDLDTNVKIGEHKDFNDKKQTITVTEPVQTGGNADIAIKLIGVAAAFGVAGYIISKKR